MFPLTPFSRKQEEMRQKQKFAPQEELERQKMFSNSNLIPEEEKFKLENFKEKSKETIYKIAQSDILNKLSERLVKAPTDQGDFGRGYNQAREDFESIIEQLKKEI